MHSFVLGASKRILPQTLQPSEIQEGAVFVFKHPISFYDVSHMEHDDARLEAFNTQRVAVAAGVASAIVASTVSEMKQAKKTASMETCEIAAAIASEEINGKGLVKAKPKPKVAPARAEQVFVEVAEHDWKGT